MCCSLLISNFFFVQVDNKGRNFLHVAVQNSDIESVLFLISVKANVNSRVQDAAKLTPLHLAVQAGSEIIVRNLVGTSDFLSLLFMLDPNQSKLKKKKKRKRNAAVLHLFSSFISSSAACRSQS